MTTWIVSGWIHFIAGVVVGWVLFKRPQFITDWLNRLWGHI